MVSHRGSWPLLVSSPSSGMGSTGGIFPRFSQDYCSGCKTKNAVVRLGND